MTPRRKVQMGKSWKIGGTEEEEEYVGINNVMVFNPMFLGARASSFQSPPTWQLTAASQGRGTFAQMIILGVPLPTFSRPAGSLGSLDLRRRSDFPFPPSPPFLLGLPSLFWMSIWLFTFFRKNVMPWLVVV